MQFLFLKRTTADCDLPVSELSDAELAAGIVAFQTALVSEMGSSHGAVALEDGMVAALGRFGAGQN
jgi:hypothetical protein